MLKLNENGYPSEREHELTDEPLSAALFTTGNGYMGVRGSFEEYASLRIQGAFVRGYIDEIIEVCEPFAENEYLKKYYLDEEGLKGFEKQESCVNMPDFLFVRVEIDGKTFYPWEGNVVEWERYLDPDRALFTRRVVWDNGDGALTEILFERFASFACQNLYCQRVSVRPLNHNLSVKLISGVDTAVKTGGQIITAIDSYESEGSDAFLSFHAVNKYCFRAAYLIRNRFPKGALSRYEENGRLGKAVLCDRAASYVLEKVTFIGTQRESDRVEQWVKEQGMHAEKGYDALFADHLAAYRHYFEPMDIVIDGDGEADGWLRFATYHTAISAPREDSVHSVAAKGLTGERYNQFVWWDCEIHQLPFFLYTAPRTAKNLLMYRYNCLQEAKKNAAKAGYAGAKFAFCSSVTGEERVWDYVRHPFMQVHINSDIPYGLMLYYDATGDREFMLGYGMEIISECVAFWASRVTFRNGRYEILQVTGTDEHHPYVDNDAYTNYCVKYILTRFPALCEELNYSVDRTLRENAENIAKRMYLPCDENGMIPQFDGYFSLDRRLDEEGKSTLKQFQMKKCGLYHKSQVIKQPDVMLLYTYLNVGLENTYYAQNWDYYETMCETSSSLTFPVHAIASVHNHRMLSFYNYFMNTLKIDVCDLHGVGWQGVHSGCLAGGYLSVLYGIFGMKVDSDCVAFHVNRVPFFKSVTARINYRGSDIRLCLKNHEFLLSLLRGNPVNVCVGGKKTVLNREVRFEI